MKSASTARYQKLIRMMEAFVSGQSTSLLAVREMEAEFGACGLVEDDRFHDLMMALDLFAVPPKDFGYGCDPKHLASECRYALRVLSDEL
jgi:hypothetical protein